MKFSKFLFGLGILFVGFQSFATGCFITYGDVYLLQNENVEKIVQTEVSHVQILPGPVPKSMAIIVDKTNGSPRAFYPDFAIVIVNQKHAARGSTMFDRVISVFQGNVELLVVSANEKTMDSINIITRPIPDPNINFSGKDKLGFFCSKSKE